VVYPGDSTLACGPPTYRLDLSPSEGVDKAPNIRKENAAASVVRGYQMPLHLAFYSRRYDDGDERKLPRFSSRSSPRVEEAG